jgi:hypothetical protein
MNVSQAFVEDLRYLRDYYEWSREDVAEVKAAIKGGGEPLVHYFTVLAAAHRAGYMQDAANGFIRLQAWCLEKGLPDPFGPEFDVAALDAMAVEPRLKAA